MPLMFKSIRLELPVTSNENILIKEGSRGRLGQGSENIGKDVNESKRDDR